MLVSVCVCVCVCVCVSRPSLFLSRIRNDVNFKLNVKMTQLTLLYLDAFLAIQPHKQNLL